MCVPEDFTLRVDLLSESDPILNITLFPGGIKCDEYENAVYTLMYCATENGTFKNVTKDINNFYSFSYPSSKHPDWHYYKVRMRIGKTVVYSNTVYVPDESLVLWNMS